MADKRLWLLELCGTHPKLRTPFRVEYDGRDWDCAASTAAMLLMLSVTWPEREDAPQLPAMRTEGVRHYVLLADLRDFAAAHEICERCDGTGSADCDMNVIIGDDVSCPLCDDGIRDVARGRIDGLVINRMLLWRYIRTLPGKYADVSVSRLGRFIRVDGESWILIQMGMEIRDDGDPGPEFLADEKGER